MRNNANFAAWKQAVENQLLLAGCIGIVDGSDDEPYRRDMDAVRLIRAGSVPPTASESNSGMVLTAEQVLHWRGWQKRETKVQGVIRATVSDGILVDLLRMNAAKEMWDFIMDVHRLDTPEEQAQVRDALATIRLKEDPTAADMEKHMDKYNSLLLRASIAQLKIDEDERIERFMATLPRSLSTLRLQFRLAHDSKKTWLEVNKQYNSEAADRQRYDAPAAGKATAEVLFTKSKKEYGKKMPSGTPIKKDISNKECYNCHKMGHFARDCRSSGNNGNSNQKTNKPWNHSKQQDKQQDFKTKSHQGNDGDAMTVEAAQMLPWACMTTGITKETSKPTWKWDEDYGMSSGDEEDTQQGVTISEIPKALRSSATDVTTELREFNWIVDSGATHHMTPLREALTNIKILDNPLAFSTAGTTQLVAKEKGEMNVKMDSGRTLTITDIHYVPSSRVNLLSANKMVLHGWKVSMTPKGGQITRGSESFNMQRQGGLWVTSLSGAKATALLTGPLVKSRTALEGEHQRLGHIGRHKLLEMAKDGLLAIDQKAAECDSFKTTDCEVCQQQKMPRFPKGGHSPRGTRNGELIHADIAGPFAPSLNSNNHFLAMIDDYSKACAIIPMIGRKPAFEALQAFVAKVERQLGEKVRFIRSDNGVEFVKGEANEWYHKKGIIHQVSTPYTPELNGTIERFMRTSKEMISTMIVDAGLGHDYWDYAARYAATILMKIGNGNDGINTWKKFTGRQANIPSVLRFGSMCFVHVPKDTRSKASFGTAKAVEGRLEDRMIMSVAGLLGWKMEENWSSPEM